MACVKRDVVVPLVYEPQAGEVDSFALVVHVSDARTAVPLVGATAEIWGSDVRATTDMGGQCQLMWLRPGRYILMVEYLGYLPLRRLIRFNPKRDWIKLDIRLEPVKLPHYETNI